MKKFVNSANKWHNPGVSKKRFASEAKLAALAKAFRLRSGKTKAQAARELGISRSTVQLAEESPGRSLTKVRCQLIEHFSTFRVSGPWYILQKSR